MNNDRQFALSESCRARCWSETILSEITPLVLTYNEEDNIERCLRCLDWARKIVVVDSLSSDSTPAIASRFSNATFIQKPFETHAAQWNFGIEHVHTNWVLSLDADYTLTGDFVRELGVTDLTKGYVAYSARFQHCVFGKPVRGSLYPPRLVLFDKRHCQYVDDGHTQALRPDGEVSFLRAAILHDDRKSVSRFLWSQDRYAELEAEKLSSTPHDKLDISDKCRKLMFVMPFIAPIYSLLFRGGFLDGWRGIYYAWQRMAFEAILAMKMIEREARRYNNDEQLV